MEDVSLQTEDMTDILLDQTAVHLVYLQQDIEKEKRAIWC